MVLIIKILLSQKTYSPEAVSVVELGVDEGEWGSMMGAFPPTKNQLSVS